MRKRFQFQRFCRITVVLMVFESAFAAITFAESSNALTNWQTALATFQRAGASIAEEKFSETRAQLAAAATNLAQPYASMAADFAPRLDKIPARTGTNDFRRANAIMKLCDEM